MKIFLKKVNKRILNKLKEDTSERQLVFRNGIGTLEAVFGNGKIIKQHFFT